MASNPEPLAWRNSKAKQILHSLLVSGIIPCTGTSKAQVQEIWNLHCLPRREFAGFQFAKFAARLRAMQKRHREGEETRVWKNSNAQHVLLSLLVSGEIPCTEISKAQMQEIWNLHCLPRQEFDGFLFAKFPARLEAMQKRHLEHRGHAELEQDVFVLHKQHFPTPTHNHRGEPQWHGSDAERFLKADVAAKTHETMPPQQLQRTRMAYQHYPLEVFRKHIHQEVRLQKLHRQYGTNQV